MAAVQPEVGINLQEPWRVGVKSLLELLDFDEVLKDLKIIKRDKNANAASKDAAISIILSKIKEYSEVLGLKNVTKKVLSRYLGEVDSKSNFVALLNKCLMLWNLPQTFREINDVFKNLVQTFIAGLNSLQPHPAQNLPIRYCMTDSCRLLLQLPDRIHIETSVADIVRRLSPLNIYFTPIFNEYSFMIDASDIRSVIKISGNCTRGFDAEFDLRLIYIRGNMVSDIELKIDGIIQSMSTLTISGS